MHTTDLHPRAYGQHASDLDVPFAAQPADEAATVLLAACLGVDPEAAAQWSLARRLQALLAVRAAAFGAEQPPLQAVLRCAHCGTRFELEIDAMQCRAEVSDTAFDCTAPGGHTLQLRLPSAADLVRWRAGVCPSPADIALQLVCQVDGAAPAPGFVLPAEWLEPVAAALAARDPLGALQAEARCPECHGVNPTAIELQALLLAEFAAQQQRLLAEVAGLARAFHWTEAQILALPAWRRAHYLAGLEVHGTGPA